MARRRSSTPGVKSALGYGFTLASGKINTLRTAQIRTMITDGEKFTPEQVVNWMIPAHIQDILRAALPYVEAGGNYSLYHLCDGVKVRVQDWDNLGIGVPKVAAVEVDKVSAAPLIAISQRIKELAAQWAMVSHVLEWLDKNATAGAIRYYWPAVMSLIPPENSGKIAIDLSDRHREPIGISKLIPMIRETAGIVASGLLLADKDIPARANLLQLAIPEHTVIKHGLAIKVPTISVDL